MSKGEGSGALDSGCDGAGVGGAFWGGNPLPPFLREVAWPLESQPTRQVASIWERPDYWLALRGRPGSQPLTTSRGRRFGDVEPESTRPRQHCPGPTTDGGGHHQPLPPLLLVAGLGG